MSENNEPTPAPPDGWCQVSCQGCGRIAHRAQPPEPNRIILCPNCTQELHRLSAR